MCGKLTMGATPALQGARRLWEGPDPKGLRSSLGSSGHTSPHTISLLQRSQFVEVPGNHCVHMSEPQHVASIISSFLQHKYTLTA